jgi:hypothetical protein
MSYATDDGATNEQPLEQVKVLLAPANSAPPRLRDKLNVLPHKSFMAIGTSPLRFAKDLIRRRSEGRARGGGSSLCWALPHHARRAGRGDGCSGAQCGYRCSNSNCPGASDIWATTSPWARAPPKQSRLDLNRTNCSRDAARQQARGIHSPRARLRRRR